MMSAWQFGKRLFTDIIVGAIIGAILGFFYALSRGSEDK